MQPVAHHVGGNVAVGVEELAADIEIVHALAIVELRDARVDVGDSIIFYRKVFARLNKTHADLLKASQIAKIVSLDGNGNAMVELSQLSVAIVPTNSIQNTENNFTSAFIVF